MDYKDSGVDIEKANNALNKIKEKIKTTFSEKVKGDIGNFGAVYEKDKDTYLVASSDGVGTKLKVAFLKNKHNTVGEDIVNHCVNDIFVLGAKPLFFLDYIATGKLIENVYYDIIDGLVRGCKANNCSLIGGETAEMPDFYAENEYDIAGFIVGEVKKKDILGSHKVKEGNVLYGLYSDGLHTNGYSLARKVLFKSYNVDSYIKELNSTVGDVLLKVHLSYYTMLKEAVDKKLINAMAHITGGGIEGNLNRVVPENLDAKIDINWEIPPIFLLIEREGNIKREEMFKAFNMGIGMICIISENNKEEFEKHLKNKKILFNKIGIIEKRRKFTTDEH